MRPASRIIALGALVGAGIGALGAVGVFVWPGQGRLPFVAAIGAPFELTRHDGTPFLRSELAGKPYAIFFGFTNCPDVCPTTLLTMTNHLRALGNKADRLNVLFVTVDPERDTPAHLANYLSSFDRRIVGLTGAPQDIRNIAREFRATFRKVPAGDGYTMDHTATVFLIDAKGRLASTLSLDEPEAGQLARLRQLIDE